VSKVNNFCYIA